MSVNPTTTTTTQGDNQPVVGAASPSESATMAAPAGNSDNVKTNQVNTFKALWGCLRICKIVVAEF